MVPRIKVIGPTVRAGEAVTDEHTNTQTHTNPRTDSSEINIDFSDHFRELPVLDPESKDMYIVQST